MTFEGIRQTKCELEGSRAFKVCSEITLGRRCVITATNERSQW